MVICVTGHRPDKLYGYELSDWRYMVLKEKLKTILKENNCSEAISGMALGVDTVFALAVLELKLEGYPIQLHCAIPCQNQDKFWKQPDKDRYHMILEKADIVTMVTYAPYTPSCMQQRNEYMTDYQAKRFAKYLLQGTYFEMAHLFDAAYKSDKPDLHGSYSTTNIYAFGNHYYVRWMGSTGENHPFYGYDGEYEKVKFNNESTADDIKERADMDKCKLKAIKSEVDIWLKEKNIALTDIRPAIKQIIQKQKEDDESYRGWKENPVDIYKKETIIGMFVLSFLKPGNYRITDYDNLKKEHLENFLLYMEKEGRSVSKKLYSLCYYRMLQYECFDRILNVADEILEERWYFETIERK